MQVFEGFVEYNLCTVCVWGKKKGGEDVGAICDKGVDISW